MSSCTPEPQDGVPNGGNVPGERSRDSAAGQIAPPDSQGRQETRMDNTSSPERNEKGAR